MARPVNADAQATQAKILATAYQLFASSGIDGASVRDIARGAGVSLAMVHHYFGSKQGLYEACISTMLTELSGLRGVFEAHMAKGDETPSGVLESAVRIGYAFAREHRTAVRLLQRSLVDTGELDERVREQNLLPFLESASGTLGALTARPAESLRLPLQSAIFLVVRYAITSDREIAALAGPARAPFEGKSDKPAIAAVEAHLVDAILGLLGFKNAS